MIATYPDFSKLSLEHKDQLARFTAKFEPYSDFNFVSLFSWNTDGSAEVAILDGNLVIRIPDYLDGHPVYSLLGDNRIDASVETLLQSVPKLELVPEAVIQKLEQPGLYDIAEDENNFDYVYDVSHLIHLKGSHFKKKRNKNNVFVKEHEGYELVVKVVKDLDVAHIEALQQVDRQWAQIASRDKGDILAERKALGRLFENFSAFELIIVEVVVDNEIKAFSVNELLASGYALCHFEKALTTHHEHLNTFLTIEVAKKLHEAGCEFMNWEQDLGLEGLRRSKQSYHPIRMLKKYTLSRRVH
jgi:hypothetical protein